MTATLEEIHRDPEIIDRAISRSERLDIVSNGVVTATFTPVTQPAERHSVLDIPTHDAGRMLKPLSDDDSSDYRSAKRLSPTELGKLAEALANAPDDETAARVREEMTKRFYGTSDA